MERPWPRLYVFLFSLGSIFLAIQTAYDADINSKLPRAWQFDCFFTFIAGLFGIVAITTMHQGTISWTAGGSTGFCMAWYNLSRDYTIVIMLAFMVHILSLESLLPKKPRLNKPSNESLSEETDDKSKYTSEVDELTKIIVEKK
ncbi:hypothetical protein EDD21DRAFT_421483 [Dissophora ornata]|nr:hypothetical protein EDD21DRAFT_421483 [Dissophora ornata]